MIPKSMQYTAVGLTGYKALFVITLITTIFGKILMHNNTTFVFCLTSTLFWKYCTHIRLVPKRKIYGIVLGELFTDWMPFLNG